MPRKKVSLTTKTRKRVIKTAVFYDPFGGGGKTVEEQIADDVKYYSGEYGPFDGKIKLNWYRVDAIHELKPKTELVLFDFGGMSMAYGAVGNLMYDHSRAVIQWALDNPSALIIVTSSFTYDSAVECEMKELGFAELPNIVKGNKEIPAWFLDSTTPPDFINGGFCGRCRVTFTGEWRCAMDPDVRLECPKCGKIVGDECWSDKKQLCGDCAGW